MNQQSRVILKDGKRKEFNSKKANARIFTANARSFKANARSFRANARSFRANE